MLRNIVGIIEKRIGKDLQKSCGHSLQTLLPEQTLAGGRMALSAYASGLKLEIKCILLQLGHPGGDGNCSVSYSLGAFCVGAKQPQEHSSLHVTPSAPASCSGRYRNAARKAWLNSLPCSQMQRKILGQKLSLEKCGILPHQQDI